MADKNETLKFLHNMAGDLAGMAKAANLDTLAYLLNMVEHEASGLGATDDAKRRKHNASFWSASQ